MIFFSVNVTKMLDHLTFFWLRKDYMGKKRNGQEDR